MTALSLPMAALLAIFEWMRRADASHLLPTGWLVWTLCGLGAVTALILGFFDLPRSSTPVEATPNPADPLVVDLTPQSALERPQPQPTPARSHIHV